MMVESAQQLRGCMERFRTTNPVCTALSAPVDELLTYGGENNEWASRRNSDKWEAFWYSTSVTETCMANVSSWQAIFHGSLLRLFPHEQRLSLEMGAHACVWITVDDTLEFALGIS